MVTGTGFIGSYIVRDLLAAGEEVVLYGRFGGPGGPATLDLPDLGFTDALIGGGLLDRATVIVGDITDFEAVSGAVQGAGVTRIVHLASIMTSAATLHPGASIRVNSEGTANVFEAAARASVEKVVWASSIGVYGPRSVGPEGTVSDESPYDPRNLYGATKVVGEQLARMYALDRGVDITGLRPGRVYGYGEHVKALRGSGSSWLFNLMYQPAIESGERVVVPYADRSLDFHYVEDVSSAFVRALDERAAPGDTYLISGDHRPLAEACDYVRSLIPGAKITPEVGPVGLPASHSTIWSYRFDAGRAERELGIRSRFSMEDGVRRTMNMYRSAAGLAELTPA